MHQTRDWPNKIKGVRPHCFQNCFVLRCLNATSTTHRIKGVRPHCFQDCVVLRCLNATSRRSGRALPRSEPRKSLRRHLQEGSRQKRQARSSTQCSLGQDWSAVPKTGGGAVCIAGFTDHPLRSNCFQRGPCLANAAGGITSISH